MASFQHRVTDPPSPTSSTTSLDSLPSPTTAGTHSPSSTSADSDEQARSSDADREWRETLQQLELVLTMVLVPYVGKYFGRKMAYWGWARFMEWKYPVSVDITSRGMFRAAGAVEAAASL